MTDLAAIAQRLDELERKLEATQAERDALRRERDESRDLILQLMEKCRKLERGLIAQQKSEHISPDVSQLVLEMMFGERARAELDAALAPEEQEVRAHKRAKPTGRKPIPENLPRVDIILTPPEVERKGLDAFEKIGEEVSETLERRPASLVVARTVRLKFVRKDRDRNATEVLIAPAPLLPIPKGLAGPGMLADTIVKRWQDHQPLHRLEGVYARDGIELARSTMCGWHSDLATLAMPLVAAMRGDAFEQPYLCTDATGVLVQQKDKCRTGHFWVVVAPGRHVLFEYSKEHTSKVVDNLLAGYEGYLVADAHVVYDHLYRRGDVVEVNCWAHCRRYFFKAFDTDPERAKIALGLIGALFRIERHIEGSSRKKKEAIRQQRSAPIVDRFYSWCEAETASVLDATPISDGIRYARNQKQGLTRFLHDGRLPIHNNMSELELRREAVGRKNWLFVGSDDAGHVNACFTSLLASCAMHDVEQWSYLRDIFCLLPTWPHHQLLELSPLKWKKTRERDDVRQLLDQNPFRKLTLLPTP